MKWIKPSTISGCLPAPPSKSLMIRATAASLLSQNESVIQNPSFCNDALAGLKIAEALGAEVKKQKHSVTISRSKKPADSMLYCQESGLCMRLFTPIAALQDKMMTISGTGSLLTRPMDLIELPLQQLGAYCHTNGGFPPIRVKGPIQGGCITLDGSISSQLLSGLLMSLPLCESDSVLDVVHLKSKPYVELTLSVLDHYGISIDTEDDFSSFAIPGGQNYKDSTYYVEGDWSGAAFLLVAGAIAGKVTVDNLPLSTLQGDKKILEVLKSAGARFSIAEDSVTVEKKRMQAFEFDAEDCPDLFPPLTVLACFCRGQSLISGVDRLRHKESDRALAIVSEFAKLGAKIKLENNLMEIEGTQLQGGIIDSHNDHRIAMAAAVAALGAKQDIKIQNWQAVTKSYPGFFNDLKSLGGDVS